MDLIKVGRNHIFPEHVKQIIAPATHANQEGAAIVQFCDGTHEAFYGDESQEIQAWLAKQLETVPPTAPVMQTKATTPKR